MAYGGTMLEMFDGVHTEIEHSNISCPCLRHQDVLFSILAPPNLRNLRRYKNAHYLLTYLLIYNCLYDYLALCLCMLTVDRLEGYDGHRLPYT